MNLGDCIVEAVPGTIAEKLFTNRTERHWHSFAFNMKYWADLEKAGLQACLWNEQHTIIMGVTIPSHPFFLATQFHPEFKSKYNRPHIAFCSFVEAVTKYTEDNKNASNHKEK